MAVRRFFSILNLLAFLVIIYCDISFFAFGVEVPTIVSTVAHIVLTVSLVFSLGFKGFIKFLLSLVLMYVIYVLLTGCLMLLGLTYEIADIVGTIVSVGFMIIMSSKI